MTLENNIRKKLGPSKDYIFKKLTIDKQKVLLIFNETLIDTARTNDFILRNLIILNKKKLKKLENHLPNTTIKRINKNEILNNLSLGFIIIIYLG